MTVQECYKTVGGDYKEIMSRLMSEDLVKRFLEMFLEDPSYLELLEEMGKNDYEEAFRASHTLKGVCQNLALTELFQISYQITEALRGGNGQEAEKLLPDIKKSYDKTVAAIHALLDGTDR